MKYNYFFTIEGDMDGYCAYVPAFRATVVEAKHEGVSMNSYIVSKLASV